MRIRWFTKDVEPEARNQVERTASMPFVAGVAVMPDVHFGRGSTVGTVVATRRAVMPACVGVDIGCGMIAVRTRLTPDQVRPHVAAVREGIEARVREAIVDEAPGAYKDIDRVMADAATLVRPTHVLRQLVSVKGD
jgi:tRNA-splicing ligase RtcB